MEFETRQNGEYENKSPVWNTMKPEEKVKVKVLEVLKDGMNERNGKKWRWALLKMLVDGTECSGFAPGILLPKFEKRLGGESFEVIRTMNLEKGKLFYEIVGDTEEVKPKPGLKLPPKDGFVLETQTLESDGEKYDEKEVLEYIKSQGRFDDLSSFVDTWKMYGSTEERGKAVFEHRNEVI